MFVPIPIVMKIIRELSPGGKGRVVGRVVDDEPICL